MALGAKDPWIKPTSCAKCCHGNIHHIHADAAASNSLKFSFQLNQGLPLTETQSSVLVEQQTLTQSLPTASSDRPTWRAGPPRGGEGDSPDKSPANPARVQGCSCRDAGKWNGHMGLTWAKLLEIRECCECLHHSIPDRDYSTTTLDSYRWCSHAVRVNGQCLLDVLTFNVNMLIILSLPSCCCC